MPQSPDAPPPETATPPAPARYAMWVAHCPFRRNGSPVLGTMGASVKMVVVMTMDEWQRLCADVPQLKTTQFNVGTYE